MSDPCNFGYLFLLPITRNVSVRRSLLFLCAFMKGCVILLWHSLGLLYTYLTAMQHMSIYRSPSLIKWHIYILKRKSFATLTKMVVPFFGPKQSLSAIDKSLYLPCIKHKNHNGVAYGCRAATIFLRQPLILKSHG